MDGKIPLYACLISCVIMGIAGLHATNLNDKGVTILFEDEPVKVILILTGVVVCIASALYYPCVAMRKLLINAPSSWYPMVITKDRVRLSF